ncbi:hypothetical protein R1flu_026191 [Riccia fluitans]|uniref:Uncharacterized protein n=1 Tax=Riccia fluitans TaxID=41844 RepID=A0ABD1XJA8_9MARC
MAMWSEELRRLTLFDGEAELTPESRPVWQQNMELRTKFVRYPGPKPDGLHPTHFWFLEHYGLLPYFLQMQAEGILAKVFFSIVSTCRYVTVAERTEHLELRGLTGRKLVVSPEVVREAFGIPRDAAHDEEQGATWPNQAPREPAGVPLQIINDYLLCKVGSKSTPSRRYNLPAVSAFLRLTYYRPVNWAHMLAGGLASAIKEYVRKFSGAGRGSCDGKLGSGPDENYQIQPGPVVRLPTQLPGTMGGLRGLPWHSPNRGRDEPRHHPRRRRETQTATCPTRITRTTAEPEVGVVPSPPREVQEISSNSSPEQPPRKEPRVGELPQQSEGRQGDTAIPGFEPSDDELPIGTLHRDISRLRQPGGKFVGPPPAREQRAAPATVEEERPDIGPRYTDTEVRRLHPELFVQLGPAPPTADVPQPIPVEKTLLDRLAEISRPEAMSGTTEGPGRPGRDTPTAGTDNTRPGNRPHWRTAVGEDGCRTPPGARIADNVRMAKLQHSVEDKFKQSAGQGGQADGRLEGTPETYCLITTPEEPTAWDLVECLVSQNSIADHRAEEAEKRVQERDEELRQAQDELRRVKEELAQTRADGKKQSRALEEELRRVRKDVVQREEETGRWIRNDEKMADFVREIARLREELLTKDAKMRELEKTLGAAGGNSAGTD